MKKLIIKDIKIPLSAGKTVSELDKAATEEARKRVKMTGSCDLTVYKRSLDMRKRSEPMYVYSVSASVPDGAMLSHIKGAELSDDDDVKVVPKGKKRVCVVGFGPCGMFASLLLSEYGFAPVVYERGGNIEQRVNAVDRFISTGQLDTETNVQFGAGGAGTFSDGKLYTRINDPMCNYILKTLVRFGAPKSVLTSAKPHVGTDILRSVVKGISDTVVSNGGSVHYNTRVDRIDERNGKVAVTLSNGSAQEFDSVILAIGHSARDTYGMLMEKGFDVIAKPYSVGVRIEHLQKDIDKGLYGDLCEKYAHLLPKGEYALADKKAGGRGAYTFCMCPGGVVVPSSSEGGEICTNGMSYSARNGIYANCAVCVSVFPSDYGNDPQSAIDFQRGLERNAFVKAGSDYSAPVTTVGDLMKGSFGSTPGYTPSYMNGKYTLCDIKQIFPEFIVQSLKDGLNSFDKKIKGFARCDVPLTGVETRTSSPVRIVRNDAFQSVKVKNVYPCGEGAGYAGGITSAAIDGIKVAKAIMES